MNFLPSLLLASKCNHHLYKNEVYKEKLDKLEKLTKQKDIDISVQNILKKSLYKIKNNPQLSDLKETIVFLQSILKKKDFPYVEHFFYLPSLSEPSNEDNIAPLLNLTQTEITYLTLLKKNKTDKSNIYQENNFFEQILTKSKQTIEKQEQNINNNELQNKIKSQSFTILNSTTSNNDTSSFIQDEDFNLLAKEKKSTPINHSFADFDSPTNEHEFNQNFTEQDHQKNLFYKNSEKKQSFIKIKSIQIKKTTDTKSIVECLKSSAEKNLTKLNNELHILREIFNLYLYCFAYKALYKIIKENKSAPTKILNPLNELLQKNEISLKNMIINYNKFTAQELKNAKITMKSLKIENNDVIVDIWVLVQLLFYKPTIKK